MVAHKASPKPSTFYERLKIMSTHVSATALEDTPHETETTQITISDALRRRAKPLVHSDPGFAITSKVVSTDPPGVDMTIMYFLGGTASSTETFVLKI